MTPFIFYYVFFLILAGVLIFAIGIYVLSKAREILNIFYFLLTLNLFAAAVCEAFLRSAPDLAMVQFWSRLWMLAWALGIPLFFHFALVFSRQRLRFIPLLYLASLAMCFFRVYTPFFVAGFDKKYFGYVYVPGKFDWIFTLFFSIVLFGGVFLFYQISQQAKEYYRRKQAQLLLISSFIPMILGVLFDVIFNNLKNPIFPLAIISTAITIGLAGYAIIRYQLITETSKEQVAEAVSRALLDAMLLTDNEEKINYVNLAACRLTGYRADELVGMEIKKIIPKVESLTTIIHKKDGTLVNVSLGVFRIFNKQGYIYFARDLTPIFRLKKSTLKMNAELQRLIEREHKVMQMLFKLSGQIEEEKVEDLCGELEKEDLELQTILRPVCEALKGYVKVLGETRRSQEGLLTRTQELERLNAFMAGREIILKELESESKGLRG